MLSRFRPESELSRLNRERSIEASDELRELTALALDAREETGGRFDPTLHDAVVAAGYDRTFAELTDDGAETPPAAGGGEVDHHRQRIELGPDASLDLGGIAKGYAADRCVSTLAEHGPALVNAGGDIAISGPRPLGRRWPVAVDVPAACSPLELDGGGLATSGRDRRRWRRNGQDRHHLIDPRTLRPAEGGPLSVTVAAATATAAEVLAKALFLAARRRARGEARRARRGDRPQPRPAPPRGDRAMKSDPTFWLLARATGLAAYMLLTVSVLAGLVVKSRPFGRAIKPASATQLHRTLALLSLTALALHGLTLVLDESIEIGLGALLVPGLVPYRPLWTGIGVLAGELMLLVYASFALRKRIGIKNWRRLHYTTYLAFAGATAHGVMAGTDSSSPGSSACTSAPSAPWPPPPRGASSSHLPDRPPGPGRQPQKERHEHLPHHHRRWPLQRLRHLRRDGPRAVRHRP